MAVVLVIFGLLLSGLMMTLTAQQASQRAQETRRLLTQAKEALIGYATINGRLPCPADPTLASGSAGAGVERAPTATGCTTSQSGALPWATLGLPENDAWARRITYRVSAMYARTVIARPPAQYGCATPPATAPAQSAFALCTPGDGNVRSSATGPALVSKVPVVLVSHGGNGYGAALPGGTTMPTSGDGDERENHNRDAVFVDKTPTDSYDDLTDWIASPVLMNRMVQSGRLP
jgi:type II secretory pathway pseudopilin PulG